MTYEERVTYLESLMYISTIDEKVEEKKLSYFNQVGQLYGISISEIDGIKKSLMTKRKTIEDILKPITERKIQITLIYELLSLCYVDESYDVIEKQGMMKICEIMGVEKEKLIEIENIILENIELQKKIYLVLERY